ncbi:hypothetical protein GGR42_001430 [Saonia flava]|uniref:SPOR domain-containing protein n=1 Tax=Saonia flava TaxID=523696 RepID=A0A846QSD4_9FLAO|nr:SPOR domain-containing protein [Saonia flava]NJB70968.1 hypothetical protein [Saonia flava]
MKTFIKVLVICCFTSFGLAQEGVVTIEQDEKIDKLLDIYKSVNESSELYRIQVFFGSHSGAQEIKSQVEIDFPGWYSKIDFESPSYRVRVGRFSTKLEAERRLIEVRKKYPSAMLLKPEKTTK